MGNLDSSLNIAALVDDRVGEGIFRVHKDIYTDAALYDLEVKRLFENGWIFLHTEGGPFERGFQRGYLTANEIDEFLRTLAYTEEFQTGQNLAYFVRASSRLFQGKVPAEYVSVVKKAAKR